VLAMTVFNIRLPQAIAMTSIEKSQPQPVVYIVDDDPSVRKCLNRLLTVYGFLVKTYCSAQEFLQSGCTGTPACLVLDVRLPGLDGFELQKLLTEKGPAPPIVFITGHGDIPMSVRAMKAGAVDFLAKPFSDDDLLNAVKQAIDKSRRESVLSADIVSIRRRLALLTPRELEVLQYVVSGHLNKQIASEMGVSEKTIKVHRGRVMHKLEALSIAGLVHMLEKVGGPENGNA
jgi:FixJ family two-component response regulator